MNRLAHSLLTAFSLLLVCAGAGRAEPYETKTLAGKTGLGGSEDGANFNASFTGPAGLALDPQGNLYVVDGNAVRKVAPTGTNWVVTTFAGVSGSHGAVDGTGPAAQFNYPQGVAIDGQANLYVADTLNDTVRKVTPSGQVTTLAGLAGVGNEGTADGTNSNARFDHPHGIAARPDALLFVADTYNNAIRQVRASGTNWVVTTIAGLAGRGNANTNDGVGAAARFNWPLAITIDPLSQLYVADCNNHCIRKLTLAGTNWTVSTLAGWPGVSGTQDGLGRAARFNRPDGVVVDSNGNVFVADGDNHTLRKITPAGQVTTLAGYPGWAGAVNGVGSSALFNAPYGLALDTRGRLYISDNLNFIVRQATSIARLDAGLAGTTMLMSWSTAATGAVLQTRGALVGAGNWASITNGIIKSGDRYLYSTNATGSSGFFRLGSP